MLTAHGALFGVSSFAAAPAELTLVAKRHSWWEVMAAKARCCALSRGARGPEEAISLAEFSAGAEGGEKK